MNVPYQCYSIYVCVLNVFIYNNNNIYLKSQYPMYKKIRVQWDYAQNGL